MDEFYQRRLFLKKKFTFTDKGIDIQFRDNDGDFSLFVAFNKIKSRNDLRIFSKKKRIILRIGIGFTLLTLFKGIISIGTDYRAFYAALATAAIIGAMFYGYYYLTSLKYYAVPIETGKYFQVLYSTPSNYAVEEFIDEIYERRKNYLRSEYFFIDYENDNKHELNKMQWLLSEGLISESEFEITTAEIRTNY